MKKILQYFNMHYYKPISTPLPINFKLFSSMPHSNEVKRMEISWVHMISGGKFNVLHDMYMTEHYISNESNKLIHEES